MKKQFKLTILRNGTRLLAVCLLAKGLALHAQNIAWDSAGAPPDGTNITLRTGGHAGFGMVINGSDIGTILLTTCDLNHDGVVSLAELKQVASACFKLWDTNNDGNLSQEELSNALKGLFPAPPPGGMQAMRMINGVAVQVPPDEMPTPDKQLAKHLLAAADSNKDGALSLQELNDYLDKSFSQWDQDGNGSLDAQELSTAFGQLAMPDLPVTAPAPAP
jgi:Ca2+-binding EF-hand superfamily protein